jgi:hypothetical protein
MPGTTAAFGPARLGGSAPLGPAFVSEWLLLQALVQVWLRAASPRRS